MNAAFEGSRRTIRFEAQSECLESRLPAYWFFWARRNNFSSESSGRSALALAVAPCQLNGPSVSCRASNRSIPSTEIFAHDLRSFFPCNLVCRLLLEKKKVV